MVNEITAGTKCKKLLITIQLAQAVPVSFNQNIHSDINFHYGTYTTHFIHSGSSTKRQTVLRNDGDLNIGKLHLWGKLV